MVSHAFNQKMQEDSKQGKQEVHKKRNRTNKTNTLRISGGGL